MTNDFLSALEISARDYRERSRLDVDRPLEVDIPNWKAAELIAEYGSLRAAADGVFSPGTVTLVDVYWRDWCAEVTERVNARLARYVPTPTTERIVTSL